MAKSGDIKKSSKLQSASPSRSSDAAVDASAIAASILDQCKGNSIQAAAEFERRVVADDSLFHEVLGPFVKQACISFVSQVIRHRRSSICRNAGHDAAKQAADAMAGSSALQARALLLLDFPLHGGKLLRFATAADCLDSANQYAHTASTMAARARFLSAVAARTGEKIVGDVLTESDLHKIFEQAKQS